MYNNYYNSNLKSKARVLRNEMTEAEKKLWYQFLRYVKPRTHRQRPIGNYIVDFYIPKIALVIEIDGDSHFLHEIKSHDIARTQYLNSLNIQVIRFTNSEIFQDFERVCIILNNILNKHTP